MTRASGVEVISAPRRNHFPGQETVKIFSYDSCEVAFPLSISTSDFFILIKKKGVVAETNANAVLFHSKLRFHQVRVKK